MTPQKIREIMLANGFTIKEGQGDLMPYVYEAARAIIAQARAEMRAEMKSIAWAIPSSQQFSWSEQDARFWKPVCVIPSTKEGHEDQ